MLNNELPMRYNFTQFPFHNNSQKCITFSQDGSWLLTNLLYHVLRVNSHYCLAIKINLLQLKITHISDILVLMCTFLGTPLHTDVIASFWDMQVNTHNIQKWQELCFLHITVRFHTYLFIFIHDKTLLIYMLSLTHPHYVCRQCWYSNKIHGSIHIWVTAHLGETLRGLTWHLLQVSVYHLLLINYIPFSFRDIPQWQSTLSFHKGLTDGEKRWL